MGRICDDEGYEMNGSEDFDFAPLRFHPIFQDYLWGGNRLSELFQKSIIGQRCAESWEVVDHAHGQSIVSDGRYQGQSLSQLIQRFGPELLGAQTWRQINLPHLPPNIRGRFPLLFKFLDAAQPLSVQVHPNDQQAEKLNPADLGKTEAWVVLATEPNAQIYAGLKRVVTAAELRQAMADGELDRLLHSFSPQVGDCVFIPAGTIHALGAGLVVAEIQQASNTTFRLFDWDRVDRQGQSRPLHIDQAIDVATLNQGPIHPTAIESAGTGWQVRANCPYFHLSQIRGKVNSQLTSSGRFQILVLLAGRLELRWRNHVGQFRERQLGPGESLLLPAALDKIEINLSDDGDLLGIYPGNN